MGLLTRTFRASSFDQSPFSDYWYNPIGLDSASGVRVTPLTAMQSWVVFSCDRVLSETMAQLPLNVYKRLPDGGKELAPKHPLYRPLHDQPNAWQTSFEWRRMMQSHLNMRGNAYSRILPGPNGPVDQLVPIHPDRVQLMLRTDGTFYYKVKTLAGQTEELQPYQVFHLRGATLDGYIGLSPITFCRETVGLDIAAQDYAARFFHNDSKPGYVLEHPGKLDEPAYNRLKKSVEEQQTGPNRHKAMILEEGMKVNLVGMTNKDAQFLEARQFTAHAICGMFRVPPHMVGILDRATHSNIEHQGIEFTTYTMLPNAVNFEQTIQRDLFFPLPDDEETEYFAEFNLDGLNRGDMPSRYAAYAIGRNWSWLSANDIRTKEGMNKIANGDIYLQPLNMVEAGTVGPDPSLPDGGADQDSISEPDDQQNTSDSQDAPPEPAPGQKKKTEAATVRALRNLAASVAQRMVRQENAAIHKAIDRHRAQPLTFIEEIKKFYEVHQQRLVESLHARPSSAHDYCLEACVNIPKLAEAGQWDDITRYLEGTEKRLQRLVSMATESVYVQNHPHS
jgi:HK97 family phage portal protein